MRLFILALFFILSPTLAADDAVEGVDYIKLDPPQPLRVPAGKIEVREFFNYSCPHCFRLQGHLAKWRATHEKEDVAFVHQPVVFSRYNGHFARVYFTIQALQLEETLHSKVYDTLHVQRQLLNSKGRFIDWLEEEHGVDPERAEGVYDSFSVQTRTNIAQTMADEYGIDGTPQLSVNGKYVLNPGLSGSFQRLLEVLTVLVERERALKQ